jgi:hypothetical protein
MKSPSFQIASFYAKGLKSGYFVTIHLVERLMVKHKDTKAPRHQESRQTEHLMPAFLVPWCLGVFVFNQNATGRAE